MGLASRRHRRSDGPLPLALTRDKRIALLYLVLLPALVFSVLGYLLVNDQNTNRQVRQSAMLGEQAHSALCVFRHDLELRLKAGLEFLREHPSGIPGFPLTVIASSINNEKATLHSLDDLNCKEIP